MKKRADGRYVKVITDPKTKKRISFYGKSAREVNQKILEYESKIESGRTFSEVANEWWEEAEPELSAQTVSGYRACLNRSIEHLGDLPLKNIEPKDILTFFKRLALENFTQKTIANHRIVINQVFNRAVVGGDIQYNPCTSVKIPKAKKNTVRPPATSTDEEKILNSDHPWVFPLFALLTGLRKGEILALTWEDIDFDNNVISVTKAVEHINNRPHIKPPKTESGNRYVPLLDKLKEKLLPIKGNPKHYIFSQDGGKEPIHKQTYNVLYEKYSKAVGITCTAHQLRHSYATVAVEEDVNPKDLQNALGHADISTTMNVYAAARKRSVEKVAEKLNNKYKTST